MISVSVYLCTSADFSLYFHQFNLNIYIYRYSPGQEWTDLFDLTLQDVLYSEYQPKCDLTVVRPVATESTAQAEADGEEMIKLIWNKTRKMG